MVTCFIRYVLHPSKLKEFETYGKLWIPLVEKYGGQHHGYFLPSEGASNIALALFSFPSLAEYEQYREQSFNDPACLAVGQAQATFIARVGVLHGGTTRSHSIT